MANGSLITDELKKLLGVPGEPIVMKVEEGAIQRYAEAIADGNPLYNDITYAKQSKYGRLVCPPGFTGWPVKESVMPSFKITATLLKAGAPPRVLDGGIEFEFVTPVTAGDTLIASTKITNFTERESKSGKMLFSTIETTYVNQDGAVALKSWQTLINR